MIKPFLRSLIHSGGKQLLRVVGAFQARHSSIETTPFLPNNSFSCTNLLEESWEDIREELDSVWENPEDIPSFHQISPDQARISKGNNWKTFAFYIFKSPVSENCKKCPKTSRILASIDGLQNAWFSILAPGYRIPPHRGPTKALVRCHLGLQIPDASRNCWIRVGNQKQYWSEGKCMLFDDTYEHEVENGTDEYRAVLFIDLDRPMDKIGTIFNKALLSIVKASHYVKDPLANLAKWNKMLNRRQREK